MASTYASVSDVQIRWGMELTQPQQDMVEQRLKDVERIILKRIPDLDSKVTSGDIDEEDLIMVESDAVLRLARNPEGYISETDGDYTYRLEEGLFTGRLQILPEEWELLGVKSRGMAILVPTPVMPTS